MFNATAMGKTSAKKEELPAALTTENRWRGFAVEQVTGSVLRSVDLTIRSKRQLPAASISLLVAQIKAGEIPNDDLNFTTFSCAVDQNEFCGTVDSFQGGEADLVLVSLVRNNAHTTPRRALGFLTENQRMNVLLSRAKWRMVLIGSLSFYRHVVDVASDLPNSDVGFLGSFLSTLDFAVINNEAAIVPISQICKAV